MSNRLMQQGRRGSAVGERLAVVKGGGEVGTAVALALRRAGWPVLVAELPRPTVLRRQLSLAEAAFRGRVVREGVACERAADVAAAAALLRASAVLPLYVGPLAPALTCLRPAVVVDARMRRHALAEDQRGEAPLVIGLGPRLCAGQHVDAVIETSPGPLLGQVLWRGATLPHASRQRPAGEPLAEGYAYAERDGLWRTALRIGAQVTAGAPLGTLAGTPVLAPLAGSLRGLVHDTVRVRAGGKLAAVHPGDWQRKEAGIGCRAADIAAAVLALLEDASLDPRATAGALLAAGA